MRKPLLLIVLLLAALGVRAEGTKEIMPTATAKGRVHIYPNFSKFALKNCADPYRLKIKIQNSGEIIYFGFGTVVNPLNGSNDLYYSLINPNGTVVLDSLPVPTTGVGYIQTYNQAVVGPKQFPGSSTTGYNAKSVTANITGDWYLEFTFNGYTDTISSDMRRELTYFDVSVGLGSTRKPGRLWSKAWQLTATNEGYPQDNAFTGKLFVYADDGIVTKVDFNGIKPIVFNVFCNSFGVTNTGNFINDRKSGNVNIKSPQYKIFLNDPDPAIYTTGAFGQITGPVTTNSYCNGGTDILVPVNKAGQVEILLEQNPAPGVQPVDRQLVEDVVPGNNTIYWDGLNGLGQPLANGSLLTLTVTYINGLTNLPLWDPDDCPNGLKVDLIRPTGSRPKMFWDDQSIGGSQELDGCILTAGCHNFTGSAIGNNNMINTWWYASTTSTAPVTFDYRYTSYGSGAATLCPGSTLVINGNTVTTPGTYQFTLVNYQGCDSIVTYTVNSATNPTVNLPPNQTLCPGESITLDAGTGYASYQWSTGATSPSIVVNQPGTYSVIVTNTAGCQATDAFTYTSSGPGPTFIKHN